MSRRRAPYVDWSEMTTTEQTEAALRNWRRDENDLMSLAQQHFELLGHADWIEIGDEAARLWSAMFEPVDPWSPMGDMLSTVAVTGFEAGVAAVARALGVDAGALKSAVYEYYSEDEERPPPLGAAGLMRTVKQRTRERAARMKKEKKRL